MPLTFIILALCLQADPTVQLIEQGHLLYEKKRYVEALKMFRQAVQKSPRSADAHYQVAATLARLRVIEGPCKHEAYAGTVLDALDRAIRLDDGSRKRALEDNDFASVHMAFRWQKIAGHTVEGDAPAVLMGVTWYGPSPGAFGPIGGVTFEPDNKASIWLNKLPEFGSGPARRKKYIGVWSVEGTHVTLTFDGKTHQGQLHKDGTLTFTDGPLVQLSDDADECSA